jgi:4-hydroxybenzoate polyprenyltransferase
MGRAVSGVATASGAVRLVHPAPAIAVTVLSGALGAILLSQAGRAIDASWLTMVAAIAGSQIFVGATNDLIDRNRDTAAARLDKPLAAGNLSPNAAVWVASFGLAVQLAASLLLSGTFLLLGLAATGSAFVYNLWLSRTPFSVVPYLVSFGILPIWIAVGIGVDPARVAAAPVLVAPFAAAAHLANAVRDFDADAALGSRNLAQLLGRDRALRVAWALALGVGLVVGAWLAVAGPVALPAVALGVIGLIAVGQGVRGPDALWGGMLIAAVCWTAAWAVATA